MEEHIEYDTIRDDFSSYGVENGQILKVKLSVVDVINLVDENDATKGKVVTRPYVHVITTSNLERYDIKYDRETPTENDQVKELKFTSISNVINIYETKKQFIFTRVNTKKIFLTNKMDISNNPILRYRHGCEINITTKPNFSNSLDASMIVPE